MPFSFAEFDTHLAATAARLGVPVADYAARLEDDYKLVETGQISLEELLTRTAVRCGVTPTAEGIAAGVQAWHAFQATQMQPFDDAWVILRHVRAAGLPIGLISNAPPPVHELWAGHELSQWFNATAFSYVEGMRKPAPELYTRMASALGVAPEHCLFVGDGSAGELQGAEAVGMRAVLIHRADEPNSNDERYGRVAWTGPSVPSLEYLAAHLEEPC